MSRRLVKVDRDELYKANYLCQLPSNDNNTLLPSTLLSLTHLWSHDSFFHFIGCPDGHMTHSFLACDTHSACWFHDFSTPSSCHAPLTPLPPYFTCDNGVQHVPYTLVCDFRSDCSDDSDEQFCIFSTCNATSQFTCDNHQCVPLDAYCDRVPHCKDGSDEEHCGCIGDVSSISLPPPAVVTFDGRGGILGESLSSVIIRNTRYSQNNSDSSLEVGSSKNISTGLEEMSRADGSRVCPDTHFQCASNGFCLPVFVRCNGLYDCLGHDESGCHSYTCPGFYRCRGSTICVHRDYICDSVYHCPQRDDEIVCNVSCPKACVCYGWAFFCKTFVNVTFYPELRYLDTRDSGVNYRDVANHPMLVYLSLVRCGIAALPLQPNLPNLRYLDLSENILTSAEVEGFSHLHNLRHLILVNNPLNSFFTHKSAETRFISSLHILNLSGVKMKSLHTSRLTMTPNLRVLNMSSTGVNRLEGDGFGLLGHLRVLDLRGCPVTYFPRGVLDGLDKLETLLTDNYKLCCSLVLPSGFDPDKCIAPTNEISSCTSLLRTDVYRGFLALLALLSLFGNVATFTFRVFASKVNRKIGFDVFVTNLCVSDFVMGIYLTVIGVADRYYRGNYLWHDVAWRHSVGCKAAGFLSLLSNEVSAFIICLITLDRFLVLCFPFSQVRFNRRNALLVCAAVWSVGIIIALTPLLPVTNHWDFYSQTGICIPLPVTRQDFAGHKYVFTIMIVLNFVLFLLIALGQGFIYWSVQKNTLQTGDSARSQRDVTLARRLIAIAVSDFLCWFPIGLLGLLASSNFPVASEVNVAMAIFVLPLNAAINPFIYTLNMVLEKLRLQKEERIKQRLLSTLVAESEETRTETETHLECSASADITIDEILLILKTWLKNGVLHKEEAFRFLQPSTNVHP